MKHLVVLLVLGLSPIAHAEWQQLPTAVVTEKGLGGQVLLLQMKYSLVIDRDENARLLSELGEQKRQQLYADMVMDKPADELKQIYSSSELAVTNKTVLRYEQTIHPLKPLSLN